MAVGFLCTTNLLSKSSGMGVHHPAMPIGPYMHFGSVVAPTPTPSTLPEERSKALGAGQLGTGCWIQNSVPTPTTQMVAVQGEEL